MSRTRRRGRGSPRSRRRASGLVPSAPKPTPTSRLASTLAETTRMRAGVKTKVARIVPCRNSLVIAMIPIRAAKTRCGRAVAEQRPLVVGANRSDSLPVRPLTTTVNRTIATRPSSKPRFVLVVRIFLSSERSCAIMAPSRRELEEDVLERGGLLHELVKGDSRVRKASSPTVALVAPWTSSSSPSSTVDSIPAAASSGRSLSAPQALARGRLPPRARSARRAGRR